MAKGESDPLGPWADADLQATTNAVAGLGADSGIPSYVRFCSNVAKLMRIRLTSASACPSLSFPCVFLLHPSPSPDVGQTPPKRVPMLDNGRHELNGKIWFVGPGPGCGHFIPSEIEDDDLLFTFVTEDLNLGHVPAIIYDPRVSTPVLRHYSSGLDFPDDFEKIYFASAEVTPERVCKAIERTYLEKMKTPDAQPAAAKLWKNGSKWWPNKNAEHRVQMYLEIALNSAFPTCIIRPEQSMPEGRSDIEILETDPIEPSKITQHAILELKVIRSFSETGRSISESESKEWIWSGVEQAAAYRNSKQAKWGALICFDMRCTDIGDAVCFQHVLTLAKGCNVCLRRWFLYASSKLFRAALATQPD